MWLTCFLPVFIFFFLACWPCCSLPISVSVASARHSRFPAGWGEGVEKGRMGGFVYVAEAKSTSSARNKNVVLWHFLIIFSPRLWIL